MDGNTKIDVELFIRGYYEKISPHISKNDQTTEQEQQQNSEQQADENVESNSDNEHQHQESDEGDHHHDQHDHEHDHHHEEGGEEVHHHEEGGEEVHHHDETSNNEPYPSKTSAENIYDEETQRLINEAEEVKRKFNEIEQSIRQIDTEVNDNKKKLDYDVGPNNEFASMIDKCFEYEDREYVYKLCPFDRTVQKSKSNHGETSIGNWKSWGDDDSNKKYLTMKFENGLACWNGPQRSTRVLVSCGIENKLVAVSEPNRCEVMLFFIYE